jgi:hypothetical protein
VPDEKAEKYLCGYDPEMTQLCEALGIDAKKTSRIVIDCPADGICVAYIEMYASGELIRFFVKNDRKPSVSVVGEK